MRFRYLALAGCSALAVASALLLPGIFSQLNNTPDINYFKSHPDQTYTVFSRCRSQPDNVDECYSAYSAAVYLADSGDCSLADKATKRRFKRLVEHAKESTITDEINADCQGNRKPSFFGKS